MIESIIGHFSDLGDGDSVAALMSSVPVPHAFALRACGERAAAFCRKDRGADPGSSSGGGGFKSAGSRRTPVVVLPSPAATTHGRTATATPTAAAARQHDDQHRARNLIEERNSTAAVAPKFTVGELEWPEVRAAKLLDEGRLSAWRRARREADSHLSSCWHGSFSCGADPFFTWFVRSIQSSSFLRISLSLNRNLFSALCWSFFYDCGSSL